MNLWSKDHLLSEFWLLISDFFFEILSKNFVSWCLRGYEQKMQNEPNFKNTKINLTYFETMNYANFRHLQRPKNEPNLRKTNPILVRHPVHRTLGEVGRIEELTNK